MTETLRNGARRGRDGTRQATRRKTCSMIGEHRRAVATAPSHYDAIVFWFEHDLFDQLLLIRALDLMPGPPVADCLRTSR